MTKRELERGIELQRSIDGLWRKREELESMQKLCFENMDIGKRSTHNFALKADKNDGGRGGVVIVSAKAAYSAVCEDIRAIEKELAGLEKELSDL